MRWVKFKKKKKEKVIKTPRIGDIKKKTRFAFFPTSIRPFTGGDNMILFELYRKVYQFKTIGKSIDSYEGINNYFYSEMKKNPEHSDLFDENGDVKVTDWVLVNKEYY